MSTLQIPTGNIVIALLNAQGGHSPSQRTSMRSSLTDIKHPQEAESEPIHTHCRLLSRQCAPMEYALRTMHTHSRNVATKKIPTGSLSQPTHTMEDNVMKTPHRRYCHSNTLPSYRLYILHQSSSHIAGMPDTNRRLYCDCSYLTVTCTTLRRWSWMLHAHYGEIHSNC